MLPLLCPTLIIGIVVGSVVTYAVLTSTRWIPTTAQLKTAGVDVYSDVACTVPVLQINWDLIGPSEAESFQAYIKNTLRYMQLVDFSEQDYTSEVAWMIDEAFRLIEGGFQYVCDFEDAKIFRKPK